MAGDEIVDGVTDGTRHEASEQRQMPRATHVASDPQTGVRSHQHALVGGAWVLNPDHRVDVRHIGVARADLAAGLAVERGKAKPLLPLVTKDELHAGRAEAARAVVQQKRRRVGRAGITA